MQPFQMYSALPSGDSPTIAGATASGRSVCIALLASSPHGDGSPLSRSRNSTPPFALVERRSADNCSERFGPSNDGLLDRYQTTGGYVSILLEIIEWTDPTGEEIIHRVPSEGSADIKWGAQCIVRESQSAVFFKDGKACDVLGPGRHTLTSLNLPILTRLLSLPWGMKSPFRCEVYFLNHKVFTQLRWGTTHPVAFRDRELGLVRLRAFGNYTTKVTEPLLFLNSIVGRQAIFPTRAIGDYFRG